MDKKDASNNVVSKSLSLYVTYLRTSTIGIYVEGAYGVVHNVAEHKLNAPRKSASG